MGDVGALSYDREEAIYSMADPLRVHDAPDMTTSAERKAVTALGFELKTITPEGEFWRHPQYDLYVFPGRRASVATPHVGLSLPLGVAVALGRILKVEEEHP